MQCDFTPAFNNIDMLMPGLLNTLKITGLALGFGIPLGLMLALTRLSHLRPLSLNLPNADIQRFPDNGASIAAFQAGRVNAVSLFHPPLRAARKKLGKGQLVIPTPAFSSPTSVGLRKEADKTFRDWVDVSIKYWYETGKIQGWL